MSKAGAVFGWARFMAPLILGTIPATRPLALLVAGLMDEAEHLTHAKGPEKLAHVVGLSHQIGETINVKRPGTINLDALDGAVTSGITAAFEAAKVVAEAHPVPPVPPPVVPILTS